MNVLTCASTRRRLQAYHDGELPIGEQIDVAAHLEWCDHCAASLTDMQLVRAALRSIAPGREALVSEEDGSLQALVLSRVGAEQTLSFAASMREMFEDMHMVYAGLGAAAATVACVMIMLNMMRFATNERSPGSNQNPFVVDARMLMPRALDQMLMTSSAGGGSDEATYTLSAVVTREGRIVNLELHAGAGADARTASSDAETQNLLGAMSRARFEPARVAGLPVAVNMVWMVAHTTVRAAKTPLEITAPPSVKKRRVLQMPAAELPKPIVA